MPKLKYLILIVSGLIPFLITSYAYSDNTSAQIVKLTIQAKIGNANAAYKLAHMYLHGNKITQNYEKAFEFFTIASNNNHIKATYELAMMYYDGKKTTKNLKKAEQLFNIVITHKKVTKPVLIDSSYRLAKIYSNENYYGYFGYFDTTQYDYEKAFEFFNAVIDNKKFISTTIYIDASYQLAMIYLSGQGTTKNDEKAFELFTIASTKNHIEASYQLAKMYYYGGEITQNYKKAFELFNTVINNKKSISTTTYIEATYQLADMYYYGHGITTDYTKAFKLFKLAAENGHEKAKNIVKNFMKKKHMPK